MKIHKFSILLGTILTFSVLSCGEEETQTALSKILGIEKTRTSKDQDEHNQLGTSNCECVPFYLCNNNTAPSEGINNTKDPTVNEYGENIIDIRFGESECLHYMDKCCTLSTQTETGELVTKPTTRPEPNNHTCGNRHPEGVGFRIIGDSDNESNYGEFPWMVAVLRRDAVSKDIELKVMECGGSLIHPQVVLTGAHCVRGKKNLFVRAGEWDTQTEKEMYPTQENNVKEVIIHEEYYHGGLHNDVALLVLETALNLSEVIETICLPEKEENMDLRLCVVSGWGKDVFGKKGKYQVILKKVEQPVIPRSQCQEALRKTRLGPRFKLHESFLCAGGEEGKDACKGDGGGPLACPAKDNPKVYVQAGIVAWGVGCGSTTPAVYVNVPHFRSWIDDKIMSLDLH